ncbi:lamin tail domain-containing protein [Streptomyces sioyaensis]|uniref:lamin tail domain-containing protein n=1 Tax=Streptomyces sioyaensis TaxID=67364 RepID=UPI003654F308
MAQHRGARRHRRTARHGGRPQPPRSGPGAQPLRCRPGAIQYDSPGRDDRSNRSLNAEWVTVKNTGRLPVNIKGWTLSDKSGHSYRFGTLRLNGHSQIRVHTGIGHDNRRDVYQDRRAYVWDNTGDTATLRNDHRRIVDAQSWGRHGH